MCVCLRKFPFSLQKPLPYRDPLPPTETPPSLPSCPAIRLPSSSKCAAVLPLPSPLTLSPRVDQHARQSVARSPLPRDTPPSPLPSRGYNTIPISARATHPPLCAAAHMLGVRSQTPTAHRRAPASELPPRLPSPAQTRRPLTPEIWVSPFPLRSPFSILAQALTGVSRSLPVAGSGLAR